MPLGMEVGLGPGDIVLYGDPATPHQNGGTAVPIFWPMYEARRGSRPQPWPHCVKWVDGNPEPLPPMKHSPNFRSMTIVAKRSPISAIAELLSWRPYSGK